MSIFVRSVNAAVQESMKGSKIMLIYLENQNDENSNSWCSLLIQNSISYIKDNEILIPVKVLNPSQDYNFFTQVFQNVVTPSIYLIRNGSVLDIISSKITQKEFEERLREVTEKFDERSIQKTGHSGFNEDPKSAQSTNVHSRGGQQKDPGVNSSQIGKSKNSSNFGSKKVGEGSSTCLTEKRHPMKESQPEVDTAIHKDEKRSNRRDQNYDKDHILSQLKKDRNDVPYTNSSVKHQSKSKVTNSAMLLGNHSQDKCTLLIRLFDGSKITNGFKANESLLKVRRWIDSQTKDDDKPYTFCDPITRKSYSVQEENLSLKSLHLVPRSVLILKPVDNYSNAYSAQHSWLEKFTGTLYDYWGYPENNRLNENSEFIANNETENETNSINEDANSFYSSASNFNTSFVSLSELNKDRDSNSSYNGNHTKLERDAKAKKD